MLWVELNPLFVCLKICSLPENWLVLVALDIAGRSHVYYCIDIKSISLVCHSVRKSSSRHLLQVCGFPVQLFETMLQQLKQIALAHVRASQQVHKTT
jgi:hypothetical protein